MNQTRTILAAAALALAGVLAPNVADANGSRGDGYSGAGAQHGPASVPARPPYSYAWSHGYYTDYRGNIMPWTPAWYSHCSATYRSFDPQTGYFVGSDGLRRFCK